MGGTIGLYVASYTGAAGCYHYQVQIEGGTDPAALSQFNGSWSGTFSGQSSGRLAFTVTNGTIAVTQPAQGSGVLTLGSRQTLSRPLVDVGDDIVAHGEFTTRGIEGTCTWSGPFLPGGARQFSGSGLWSCSDGTWSGRRGEWTADRAATPGCTFTLSRTAVSAPATASTANVTVTTQAGCSWTASSGSSFVGITTGSSGTGTGSVTFSVGANTGAARTGTLTIAGQAVTVSQAGTTGGGTTTTFVSSSGISCVGRGNGPVQGTCSGQIVIRVGQSLPVGTTIWAMVQAQNFLFGSVTSTTSPPGQVTITIQGQIQMFDFDDNIVCPRSITSVSVMRDSRTGASLGNLTGMTIPVTCRRG